MKLAHLVPTYCLPALISRDGIDTHMALANLVVGEERYFHYYRAMSHRGDTVILDNPVHEDRPVRFTTWINAIKWIRPQIAILPDIIDDANGTIANTTSVLITMEQLFGSWETAPELMAVPHDITQEGWLECAKYLCDIPAVSRIGISLERRLGDDRAAYERRLERLEMFRDCRPDVPVHFLGISEAAAELADPEICAAVATADTSKFAVFALTGKMQWAPAPISEPYPGRKALGGSIDYFSWEGVIPSNFSENLAVWSRYANGGRS